MYDYDTNEETTDELQTLKGGKEEVMKVLQEELQERLDRAGIKVIEARITYIAYAEEIAETMLKKQ